MHSHARARAGYNLTVSGTKGSELVLPRILEQISLNFDSPQLPAGKASKSQDVMYYVDIQTSRQDLLSVAASALLRNGATFPVGFYLPAIDMDVRTKSREIYVDEGGGSSSLGLKANTIRVDLGAAQPTSNLTFGAMTLYDSQADPLGTCASRMSVRERFVSCGDHQR